MNDPEEKEKVLSALKSEGIPTGPEEAASRMISVTVPVYTSEGASHMDLIVHPALKQVLPEVFQILTDKQFLIDPETTGCYRWSRIKRTGKLSNHALGFALDINWTHNAAAYTPWWTYEPYKDPYSITEEIAQIFESYGFHWGGRWEPESFDPMHFCYLLEREPDISYKTGSSALRVGA